MKVVKTLVAGEKGTKGLAGKYGERLVCVRCRYDARQQMRFKTVELIEEAKVIGHSTRKPPRNKIVQITVAYGETRIGKLVRAAGGRWNRRARVWELPYGQVLDLGLEERLVSPENKSG